MQQAGTLLEPTTIYYPATLGTMSDSERVPTRSRARFVAIAGSPIVVWAAFVLVHLWLGLLCLYAPNLPLGDVTIVYKFWTDQALLADFWVGIDSRWVYPIVALVPMLAATTFGPTMFASTWLTMIMLLNAVAFGFLTNWGRSRDHIAIAWWWVGFLVALGPIALGRIDSVTIPIAIVGVLFLAARPVLAALLLTIATWIKVWPAALLGAIVIADRDRWRIVGTAAAASGVIVVIALLLGSGGNVFSFITEQTGRGLQIEAPISTFWLWQAFAGVPATFVYYDNEILTYQVQGRGVEFAAAIATPIIGAVAIGLCFLGELAIRNRAAVTEVLPPLALSLVTALIAFNKVGSPQFITWLAVPIILGLAANAAGHGPSFRTPATIGLVLAGLTQSIYPYFYNALLSLEPPMLIILTARNLLLFVLLGWAIAQLVRVSRRDARHESIADREVWLPAVWPRGRARETLEEVSTSNREHP